MNKKLLSITIAMLFLVMSIPVNAGIWDDILGLFSKKAPRYVDDVTKQGSKRYVDDIVEETYDATKTITSKDTFKKQVDSAYPAKGPLNGWEWERKAGNILCSNYKCYYSGLYRGPGTYVIRGGKQTNRWIQEYLDRSYKREPDFLKVTENNRGQIEKITILDAKTSPQAKNFYQSRDFKELCKTTNKMGIECEVQYGVPKSTTKNSDIIVCLTIGVMLGGPDPTDILCLIS